MIPSAFPEANRLVYRIRTAITGESTGMEAAKLAWQLAEAVERANRSLKTVKAFLDDGKLLDALLEESEHPRLLESCQSLDHPLTAQWEQRCTTYHWRLAPALDGDSSKALANAIEEQGELKDWLYKQYRAAVRSKEAIRAYRIIRLMAQRYGDDPAIKEELQRQQTQALEKAVADTKDAAEQLIPAEKPEEVAKRYEALALPLDLAGQSHFIELLEAVKSEQLVKIGERISALASQAENLDDDVTWQQVEKEYLEIDYTLAIHEARGAINEQAKEAIEKIATQLGRRRAQFESNTSIRLAIEAVKSPTPQAGKPQPVAARVAKLRSLESQATRTGLQIPKDLQEEIKSAYAWARNRKLPLLAGAVALLLILGIGTVFLLQNNKQRQAEEALQVEALTALQQVEKSGQVTLVEAAIAEWDEAIALSEASSPLADQAALLKEWLALQERLETEYQSAVADFRALTSADNALENESAIATAVAQLRAQRNDLAPDLGNTQDEAFTSALQRFQDRKKAAEQAQLARIATLENELKIAAQNASQARSRAEFERLQTATETRAQGLHESLKSPYAKQEITRLDPILRSIAQQLSDTERKWDALDNAWIRLANTKELEAYLQQLERIHSFDILPAKIKTQLDQTLRLKGDFANAKQSLNLFPNEAASREFGKPEPYLEATITLSPEERAYLERLKNNTVFQSVYQTEVQYFEGSSEPQSEYTTFLVEPVAKTETDEQGSSITFSFSVRGFDEFGLPKTQASDIQFISREDGSFWGFYYKPSKLSPESEYFNKDLQNALSLALNGSDRLAIVKQLVALESREELSPAFRLYWQQELLGFLSLSPWKSGLALSPALQRRSQQLATLPSGTISQNLWLSTIEQTVPSPEYSILTQKTVADLGLNEIKALSSLYEAAAKGLFHFAGYTLPDGKPALLEDTPTGQALWSVNALTGKVEAITAQSQTVPYAPLLRYTLQNQSKASELFENVSKSSGLKLGEAPYKALVPSLYTESK